MAVPIRETLNNKSTTQTLSQFDCSSVDNGGAPVAHYLATYRKDYTYRITSEGDGSIAWVSGRVYLYDSGHDGYLDLTELKVMMEKLGAPQTHLGLKGMISEVDEDHDGKISFREFLLIYRKAQAGELDTDSGLNQLARLTEINVEEVGVCGAKNFFEAKIEQQLRTNKFHDEIRQEQEERRMEEEQKGMRRAQFQQRAAIFQQN